MATPFRSSEPSSFKNSESSSDRSLAFADYLGSRLNHVLSQISDHERDVFFGRYEPQNPTNDVKKKTQEIAAEEEVKQEEKQGGVLYGWQTLVQIHQKSTDHEEKQTQEIAAEEAKLKQEEKECINVVFGRQNLVEKPQKSTDDHQNVLPVEAAGKVQAEKAGGRQEVKLGLYKSRRNWPYSSRNH